MIIGVWVVRQAAHDLISRGMSEACSGKLLCFGGSVGEHINADQSIEWQEN